MTYLRDFHALSGDSCLASVLGIFLRSSLNDYLTCVDAYGKHKKRNRKFLNRRLPLRLSFSSPPILSLSLACFASNSLLVFALGSKQMFIYDFMILFRGASRRVVNLVINFKWKFLCLSRDYICRSVDLLSLCCPRKLFICWLCTDRRRGGMRTFFDAFTFSGRWRLMRVNK